VVQKDAHPLIITLAVRQHGVVARVQLHEAASYHLTV
jgi:hypothetical protein